MAKPFMPEDIGRFQDMGQLHAASTADHVAWVVRTVDLANDSYVSTVWAMRGDAAPRPFTTGSAGDDAPHWSPDGTRLGFISARGGTRQVHLLAADGGEARPLTSLPEGVAQFSWSPDGKRLLVAGAISVDPESRTARATSAPPAVDAPELAWRLPYKSDGAGYTLARAFVLFDVDAATGEAKQVTPSGFDVLSAGWSPDGRRIVYSRTREDKPHRTDVWTANADGSDARQLTRDLATVMSPRWSPDGRWIVLAGARDEGDAQSRLFLVDVATGNLSPLGHDDMEVGPPDAIHWLPDSSAVVLIIAERACQVVVSVAVADGRVTRLVTGERHISELALGNGRLYYFSESAASPRELFIRRLGEEAEHRATSLNAWWDERTPLEAELREFTVPDGAGGQETIVGWMVRAKGSTGPQPLLVEAHGGPNAFALLGFPWNTYWNTLCSIGWTIVVPHAVGSTSFGRRFAERLNGHWGELDFPQYMAVVDALQAQGIADDRVVIAGKSYGGYMSAWAIGHTHRFKAAIVAAPVANLESHFGTSDGGYYGQPYVLGAERHIDPEHYRKLSPVNYIHTAKTPTLILQGKEDERCPRGQAEELFATMRRAGHEDVELVMYPRGGHHFFETGKPSHRLDVVKRMMGWLAKWVPAMEQERHAA